MSAPPPFSPERIAAAEIEPDLMLLALETAADSVAGKRRREPDTVAACAMAYVEYIGLDAEPGEDVLTEADLLVIAALASRMAALSDVLEQRHLANRMGSPDADGLLSRWAVIEAACSTPLLHKDGRPQFQLLDFLARASQPPKETPPW